ncbi:hypothetical protein [Pelagerythrobacter marinus]|uniref:hypothetical protein n=1 Tax=Pelagerythrobacter marinus TaxID=538382 RepID=UPI0020375DF4|nr:hypothetical protein [Pelagerythrobacter marinus]USA40258.1 hypothetical protein NCF86_03630 [Pelagerythrobacter marinus]WPZ05619.1 hypothetical protein T8T98_09270 [Pelagerythrobacter marinus]
MSRYAKDTSVPVANSKAEIERILERYGADQFMSGWSADQAVIGFTMLGRQVRFVLPMPDRGDTEFTVTPTGRDRSADAAHKAWEQACRQRWRALALVIKAKLEAVESEISVFEDEFMANIVLPNGRTVSDEVRPRIAAAYDTGDMPNLLPDYSGSAGNG